MTTSKLRNTTVALIAATTAAAGLGAIGAPAAFGMTAPPSLDCVTEGGTVMPNGTGWGLIHGSGGVTVSCQNGTRCTTTYGEGQPTIKTCVYAPAPPAWAIRPPVTSFRR